MYNTKYILLYSLLLVLLPSLLYAQEEVTEKVYIPRPLQSQHATTATVLGLGYQYEKPLTEKWLLNIRPSLRVVAYGTVFDIIVFGGEISLSARYYYNRAKRIQQGKSLTLNTGHFWGVGASYTYIFDNSKLVNFDNTIISIPEVFWGGRSNLGGQFFFDYSLGFAIGYSKEELSRENNLLTFLDNSNKWFVSPHLVLNFGYVFK